MTRTKIIAVAGGTASGKTTLARDLVRVGGAERVQIIPLDAYYRCHAHLAPEERAQCNYDHPDAFEIELLEQHLAMLLAGESVHVPEYDFSTHSRAAITHPTAPSEVILVEGILALHFEGLRRMYSSSVFVDTVDDLRFLRRMSRDVRERGRTQESVVSQWKATVHPMHIEFCEPTKEHAVELFNGEAWDDAEIQDLLDRLTRP